MDSPQTTPPANVEGRPVSFPDDVSAPVAEGSFHFEATGDDFTTSLAGEGREILSQLTPPDSHWELHLTNHKCSISGGNASDEYASLFILSHGLAAAICLKNRDFAVMQFHQFVERWNDLKAGRTITEPEKADHDDLVTALNTNGDPKVHPPPPNEPVTRGLPAIIGVSKAIHRMNEAGENQVVDCSSREGHNEVNALLTSKQFNPTFFQHIAEVDGNFPGIPGNPSFILLHAQSMGKSKKDVNRVARWLKLNPNTTTPLFSFCKRIRALDQRVLDPELSTFPPVDAISVIVSLGEGRVSTYRRGTAVEVVTFNRKGPKVHAGTIEVRGGDEEGRASLTKSLSNTRICNAAKVSPREVVGTLRPTVGQPETNLTLRLMEPATVSHFTIRVSTSDAPAKLPGAARPPTGGRGVKALVLPKKKKKKKKKKDPPPEPFDDVFPALAAEPQPPISPRGAWSARDVRPGGTAARSLYDFKRPSDRELVNALNEHAERRDTQLRIDGGRMRIADEEGECSTFEELQMMMAGMSVEERRNYDELRASNTRRAVKLSKKKKKNANRPQEGKGCKTQ